MVPRLSRKWPPAVRTNDVDTPGNSGMFMFVGPVLLILTTIFEWIMGNVSSFWFWPCMF